MKARMFNRQASDPQSKPDDVLKALALQPGQKVADLGAGGGYFSLRFAEEVGAQGHVYALDTDSGKIEFMRKSIAEEGVGNIEVVLVGKENLTLPEKVDMIFLRNVYHHISNRVQYFSQLRQYLKPNGRIAIVEHKGGGGFHSLFEHRVSPEAIIEEMTSAGYLTAESLGMLPKQSFIIFSLNK